MNYRALIGLMARAPGGGGGFDPDAEAYFTAAGITDAGMKTDANQFYLDAKADGYYADLDPAFYLFLGGDATKHSYNGFNPATFQITWVGTVTQNANGMTGDGSTGYGDTGIVPASHLTDDDTHLSLYSRTSAETGTTRDMGCLSDSGLNAQWMALSRGGSFTSSIYTSGTNLNVANADAQGHYIASRRGNADFEGYKNGSSIATNTGADGASRPSASIVIGGRNNAGTVGSFSNRNFCFASVGKGLNDAKAADLYAAVQALQTARGRNV